MNLRLRYLLSLLPTSLPKFEDYSFLIIVQPPEEHDPQSQLHLEREWRFERNSRVRREASKQQARAGNFIG